MQGLVKFLCKVFILTLFIARSVLVLFFWLFLNSFKYKSKYIFRQKMGRLGTPGEIANLIVYLASDEVNKKFRFVFFNFNSTLSLLGYLKTRICWGGSIWPPSKSHVLCPNMTNDATLESSCALLLESAKKMQICKNWIFDRKIQF